MARLLKTFVYLFFSIVLTFLCFSFFESINLIDQSYNIRSENWKNMAFWFALPISAMVGFTTADFFLFSRSQTSV